MSDRKHNAQLIVEGKNDQHVIWALCEQHDVEETFLVEDIGGVTDLLNSIPVRLKIPQLKAFIHTWLAWQESPGRPMGQAITAHCFEYNAPLANLFVEWLRNLFEQE